MISRATRLLVLVVCAILVIAAAAPAAPKTDTLEARILHRGMDERTQSEVLLINKGAKALIAKGEIYRVIIDLRNIGDLSIQSVTSNAATGLFTSPTGHPAPSIGDVALLELYAKGDSSLKAADLKTRNTVTDRKVYKVGSGDVLKISAWPKDTLPETVAVRPDGTVSLPFIGVIYVENRSVFDIADMMQARLERDFKRPWVEVSVGEYRSKTVRIIGEVMTTQWRKSGPGEYPLQEGMKLVDFISLIGGPTPNADLRKIRITRAGGEEKTLDLYKALENPSDENNVILSDGDLVYVPSEVTTKIRVQMLGQLRTQGAVFLTQNHALLTDAISLAGGMESGAALDSIRILRKKNDTRELVTADLSGLSEGKTVQDITLQDEDVIYAPLIKVDDTAKIRVLVLGQTHSQGIFFLEQNHAQILDGVSQAGGMLDTAAADKIIITRNINTKKETYTLDLSRMSNGEPPPDFTLQEGDIVFIPQKKIKKNVFKQLADSLMDFLPILNTIILLDKL
jgi:protein involved in polysaccharide export with SLBB domain